MVKKSLAVLGTVLLLHGIAHAADANSNASAGADGVAPGQVDPGRGTWAVQAQLGLIMTSGDTSTKSGNGSFGVAHRMGRWTLSGGLGALYASTGHITTQQDTNARLRADMALSPRTFWFSTARWDRNLFSGFRYQESIASGGGFKFIKTPATLLAAELGVGYRREQPEILVTLPDTSVHARGLDPVVNDAVLQAGVNYSHSITHLTKVVNALVVQYGSSDTTTTDNLSLQVKVDASLSLAVGMQLVNNTNPPPGAVRHTDTVMTVNLIYTHKNPKLSGTDTTPQFVSNINMLDLP
ncbi:MAG: DUF481 domain-containing protein [Steroidobacteraceae bacterium]